MKEKFWELIDIFKEIHLLSKVLSAIILFLLLDMPNNFFPRKHLVAILILFLILIVDFWIITYTDKQNIKKFSNREAFAGFVFGTYTHLNCYNRNFAENILPNYLFVIQNEKFIYKRLSSYENDERDLEQIFIDFAEHNELPLTEHIKQTKYQKCAYLYLLTGLVNSYLFSDYDAPCKKSDEELFLKLLDLCSFK